jgi:spore coat protein U-like protein
VRNPIRIKTAIAVAAIAAAFASPAHADSKSTNLPVSATVNANCTISATPLVFGVIDTLSATAKTGTGGVAVACTNGSSWTITADIGAGSGASYTSRRMTANGNTLDYNLFTDSGYANVWGDGTGATSPITGTGSGASQAITIYGRVPGGQSTVPAGSYTDLVSVTVTY